MTIPVSDVKGIGPKTAQYLQAYGITTAEALIEAGTARLVQAPGFSETRAIAVIKAAAGMTGNGIMSGKKKDKDKKHKKRKNKDRKKDKKSKKDKKNRTRKNKK